MESPAQGRPNRETGLPPGVEVGPLGTRFVAFLINLSVPVIVSSALILLLPSTTGALRLTLGVIGAVITIGWLVLIWYTLAVGAASPGLRAMKLQLVGFLDGRPIGPGRVFIRALVFWALFITGIGLLIMLIMMLRHPRKQGWHDLAVTSVMIMERHLAPPVQPARAAVAAAEIPSAQVGGTSQPQPSGVRAASPQSYAPGEGYGPAQPCAAGPADPAAGNGACQFRSTVCRRCASWRVGFAARRQRLRDAVPGCTVRAVAIQSIANLATFRRRTLFAWAAGGSGVAYRAAFSFPRLTCARGHARLRNVSR